MKICNVRRLKTFEEIHPSWHHVIKDEHKKFLGKKVHIQMTLSPNWVYVRECGPNRTFNLAWFKSKYSACFQIFKNSSGHEPKNLLQEEA